MSLDTRKLNAVKNLLKQLKTAVHNDDAHAAHTLYTGEFVRLADTMFQNESWPEPVDVASTLNNDGVLIFLYKQIYLRHLFLIEEPSMDLFLEAWHTYTWFFDYILSKDTPVPLVLSNLWMWDIMDSFVGTFIQFWRVRYSLDMTADEEDDLAKSPNTFSPEGVINFLSELTERGHTSEVLKAERSSANIHSILSKADAAFATSPLYSALGFFAVAGMARVHASLGDPWSCLESISDVDMSSRSGLHTQVRPCYLSLAYYAGYALMRLGHFRAASELLVQVVHSIREDGEEVEIVRRMHHVLMVSWALSSSSPMDPSVAKKIDADTLKTLQSGSPIAFQNVFRNGCPLFISSADPAELPIALNGEPLSPEEHQCGIFEEFVKARLQDSELRSYLRLHTAVTVKSLQETMRSKDEGEVVSGLMALKHHDRIPSCTGSDGAVTTAAMAATTPATEYSVASTSNFAVKDSMVHIADARVERRFYEHLINSIGSTKALTAQVEAITFKKKSA